MKKKLIAVLCIVAALILAVCLLPWPTRINMDLRGAVIDSDGEAGSEVSFTVTGWKLDFLLFSDRLNADISFPENASLKYAQTTGNLLYEPDFPFLLSSFSAYNSQNNVMTTGNFALNLDQKSCFMICSDFEPGPYLVASADPNADLKTVLQSYSQLTG